VLLNTVQKASVTQKSVPTRW